MPKLGRSILTRMRQTSGRSYHSTTRTSERNLRQRRGSSRDLDLEAPIPRAKVLQREGAHAASYKSLDQVSNGEDLTEDDFKMRLEDARDVFADDKSRWLNPATGEQLDDEDDALQEFAKEQLLSTYNNAQVRMTAEVLIDDSWLGNVDALPGNIYRLAVMGDIFVKAGRLPTMQDKFQVYAKMAGLIMIVMIQVVGPPMIFMSRMFGFGVLTEQFYQWECCPWYRLLHPHHALDGEGSEILCGYHGTAPSDVSMFDDWAHIKSTKALGMLMMVVFILNGLFVLLDERKSWKQIYNTFRYLDVKNTRFKFQGMSFLYVDACINCWVITWSCLDVFLLIGAAANPSDVLMNALALMFLYNLDDIGGDFGFVDIDDWPGARLAWIYKCMVLPCPDSEFDEDQLDPGGWFALIVYNVSFGVLSLYLFVLPLLAAFTPFIQIMV